ncbi:MAG TPA: DUF4189 domain-containing protein [Candidatus Baltobacteraceae bacterium]|nr:DUF4189 domain-containing protein [Candidatus Baltobacteraceae bacterium]
MKHGRFFAAFTAVATAAVLGLGATSQTFAGALPYGAIASERGNDDAVGHATGYATKEGAVAGAIAVCNKYTDGKDDCTLRVWFHKQRCAAYVASSDQTSYYFGDSKDEVIEKAHSDFPDGKVIDTACN